MQKENEACCMKHAVPELQTKQQSNNAKIEKQAEQKKYNFY